MSRLFVSFFFLVGFMCVSCKEGTPKETEISQSAKEVNSPNKAADSLIVYESSNLIIKKLSDHVYQHISFLTTNDFGKVDCNGMFVVYENEGVVFDTPTDNESSAELITFITESLETRIKAIIPTHFHEDCVGGIQVFEEFKIPMYASKQTVALLENNGQLFSEPPVSFDTNSVFDLGSQKVFVDYFGEGHTVDNVVGYFPKSQAVFGGCLVKTVGANKGFLGDANTETWSETVQKIKTAYPDAKIVIPGHGNPGGTELLDYTIELLTPLNL